MLAERSTVHALAVGGRRIVLGVDHGQVGARPAIHSRVRVGYNELAGFRVDHVVARVAVEDVVPVPAHDRVVGARSEQLVVAVGPEQMRGHGRECSVHPIRERAAHVALHPAQAVALARADLSTDGLLVAGQPTRIGCLST